MNDSEVRKIVEENKKLRDKIISLESEITGLKAEIKISLFSLKQLEDAQLKIKEIESENDDLKVALKKIDNKYNEIISENEHKYLNESNKLKSEISYINFKYDWANRLSDYMTNIEESNRELSTKVNALESEHKSEISTQKIKTKIQLDDVKHKTLSILSETKIKSHKFAMDNMSNGNKLNILQNMQLKNELNEQSKVIESVLLEIQEKEKLVRNLRIDLEINKELVAMLTVQNRKLTEMLKSSQAIIESNSNKNINKIEEVNVVPLGTKTPNFSLPSLRIFSTPKTHTKTNSTTQNLKTASKLSSRNKTVIDEYIKKEFASTNSFCIKKK